MVIQERGVGEWWRKLERRERKVAGERTGKPKGYFGHLMMEGKSEMCTVSDMIRPFNGFGGCSGIAHKSEADCGIAHKWAGKTDSILPWLSSWKWKIKWITKWFWVDVNQRLSRWAFYSLWQTNKGQMNRWIHWYLCQQHQAINSIYGEECRKDCKVGLCTWIPGPNIDHTTGRVSW